MTDEEIHYVINRLIDPKTDFKGNFNKLCRDDNQISILFQNVNYCDIAAINQLNKAGLYKSLYEFIKSTNDGNNGNDIDDSEITSMSSDLNKYSCNNKPTNEEHKKVLNATVDKITSDNKKIITVIADIISTMPPNFIVDVEINPDFTTRATDISTNVCKKIIKMYFGLDDSKDCQIVYKLNNLFELLNFFINESKRRPDDEKNKQILGVVIKIFGQLLTQFIEIELKKTNNSSQMTGGATSSKEIAINTAIIVVCGIIIIGVLAACIYFQINIDPSIFWYRRRPALININL